MSKQTLDDYVKIGGLIAIIVLVGGIVLYIASNGVQFTVSRGEEPVARSTTSYGWLKEEQWTVTATGNDGSATASTDSDGPIRGHVYAIHLQYASGISTTTDLTLSLSDPSLTVMALTNYYTDTWYYPVVEQTDSAGSGTSTYDRVTVSGHLTADIAQSTATDVVTVTVWWGE